MKFKKNIIADMLTSEKSVSINSSTTSGMDTTSSSLKVIAKLKSVPVALLSVGLLLSAVGTYINYSTKLDKNRQEISYLSDLAKNSEKMAKNTFLIQQGDTEGFKELTDVKEKVSKLLIVLKNGGKNKEEDSEVDPIPEIFSKNLTDIINEWSSNQVIYDNVLSNANNLVSLRSDVKELNIELKSLENNINSIINKEQDQNLRNNFIEVKFLLERLLETTPILFETDKYDYETSYEFIKDLKTINDILINASKGEQASRNPEVLNTINSQITQKSMTLIDAINKKMIPLVGVLADTQASAKSLRKSAKMISAAAEELNGNYLTEAGNLKYQSGISIILFILSAVGFGLLTLIFYEKSEIASRGKKIAEKNQANENSINLLIKKMNPLDEGDFTQRVYVDDKFVGRIAEKVDNTREIFGNIVKKIKNTSILVKSSANETDNTSKNLLELSSAQYRQMGNSIVKLGRVSSEMDEVAQTAWIAKEDALKSKLASEKGVQLVEESIQKMNQIRDTIQDSSKKIKKSSESAQAITEVTGIIQNITKQIEILALNAAIQAASSGESGREFTVVAQSVQELASASKEATNRILELVSDVQKDIGGAVNSMEKTTQEVVVGARLTDEAGKALDEIKELSQEVADKIEKASQKIEERSSDMANISLEMKNLQDETEKTADIVRLTSEQVDRLKTISEELENSVHGFKVEE